MTNQGDNVAQGRHVAAWLFGIAGAFLLAWLYAQTRLEILGMSLWRIALAPLEQGGVRPVLFMLLGAMIAAPMLMLLRENTRQKLLPLVAVIYAAVLVMVFTGMGGHGFWPRLLYCAVVGVMLLAMTGAGLRILEVVPGNDRQESALERAVLGCGLGAGIFWSVVLVMGMAGVAGRLSVGIVVLLMLVIGARALAGCLRRIAIRAGDACRNLSVTGWAGLGLVLGIVLLLMPGAMYPPLDYDVLEYHLQLPREYIDLGRIAFLPHNAFSGFPQATEILSYAAMLLGGGSPADPEGVAAMHGLWMAKLLHFAFLPLLLLAVLVAVRRFCVEWASGPAADTGGIVAALLCLAAARTLGLAMVMYVELALAFYTVLAFLCVVRAWQGGGFMRWAALAGIMAGCACCAKYTGLIFAGAPVFLLLLVVPGRREQRMTRVRGALLAGVACWLVLGPWLARNALETGNPFYPIWNRAFGVQEWSSDQGQRFLRAHSPAYQGLKERTYGAGTLAAQAYRVLIGGKREICGLTVSGSELGCLALVFVPGLLCLGISRAALHAGGLLLWVAACLLAWLFLTHRLERFFHFAYVLLCVASGAGLTALLQATQKTAWKRVVLGGAVILSMLMVAAGVAVYVGAEYFRPLPPVSGQEGGQGQAGKPVLSVLLGDLPPERMLRAYYAPWSLRQWMMSLGSRQARVLLVGSADPFWLPARVQYAVVFSRHPLWRLLAAGRSAAEISSELRGRGITHVYINWRELARLHSTYYRAYQLTPEQQAVLRNLLNMCVRQPLWSLWRPEELGRAWVGKWVRSNGMLMPGGRPAGNYCRTPYEIFRLR